MTQKVMELMSGYHLTAEQAVEVACDPDLEARLLVPADAFKCEVCRNFQRWHGSFSRKPGLEKADTGAGNAAPPGMAWCEELQAFVEDIR